MDYIFDESDEFFRFPNTALSAPGKLELRIKLRRNSAINPKVFIYPDGGEWHETHMDFEEVHGQYDIYKAVIELKDKGLYWYHFLVQSSCGGTYTVPQQPGGGFQVSVFAPPVSRPSWLDGGIIYHVFVDRFYRAGDAPFRADGVQRTDWGGLPYFEPDENGIMWNNDFFGGDLPGVIAKLPYLKELGVSCIYLSPVFEAASNHKYDTGDFMRVDEALGGDKALEDLCTQALGYGMRVILDGVFNHVGSESRYFNRSGHYDSLGAYQSEESPYRSWFNFHPDGTYDSWWGIELLPSLNENEPGYRDFICGPGGVIEHWMNKGVAGWRLDVVDELPDSFLDPLCSTVKRISPQGYIVGEVWEDASHKIAYGVRRRYFQGGQLDSVTNYPLKNAIIACIKEGNTEQLASTMSELARNYPKHVLDALMNILGTHDTMRILTVLGGSNFPEGRPAMSKYELSSQQLALGKKRLKLAATLQFTLPGTPCVYYGDEVGMTGGADPFNRRCYPWGAEDTELLKWYRSLSSLRRKQSCFTGGDYKLTEARAGLFAFTRGSGSDRVLIAVNVSDGNRTLTAPEFNYDLLDEKYIDTLCVKAGEPGVFAIRAPR